MDWHFFDSCLNLRNTSLSPASWFQTPFLCLLSRPCSTLPSTIAEAPMPFFINIDPFSSCSVRIQQPNASPQSCGCTETSPPHYKARLSFYLCLWLGGSGHCYGFLHPSESFGWCRLQQLHTVSGRIRPKSVLPGSLILSDMDFLSSVFILRYRSRYIFVAC